MIIKIFDNGWGNQYPLKQYEQSIVNKLLCNIANDSSQTVLINSVWYTNDYHQTVLEWLRNNRFDQIVLVAMLDAAIPWPDWYKEFNCTVHALGYYPGSGAIDFCALFVDHFFDSIDIDTLVNYHNIDTAFMCLNRKPHWHRRRFYRELEYYKLLDRGIVSMGGETQAVQALPVDRLHDELAPNATRDHYGIPNDIVSLGHWPNWQRHFLNVVTETFFNINQSGFVSEKIYKPIVGCRPFLVYDTDGATGWLTRHGFEPYVTDFGDISPLDLTKHANIAPFLATLSQQPTEYLKQKYIDLMPKILYNKNHFAEHVRRNLETVNKGISCPV